MAEKECEKGSEWLMPFTTNILTISLHQHNLTKSPKKGNNVTFTIRKTTTEEKLKTLVGLTGVGLLIWWLFFE
ncbi:hypothetical protein GMA11_08880 [Granulicatella sp. zg-ZJ]|nr:hypothetical protein [Granulicatella sp. zg-ZJ]